MSMCVSSPCEGDRFSRHPFGGGGQATAASLVQLSASTETTKTLTVTTDDGDKVTLQTHTAASVGYARYGYRGRLEGARARFSAEALTVTVSQDVSLTVEGDLSDEEKADIAKLVDVLEGAVRKGAADDPAGTLASALAGDGALGSLAGFEYTVTRAVNVSIAEARRVTRGTPAVGTSGAAAPAGSPAATVPAVPAAAPAAQASDGSASAGPTPAAPATGDGSDEKAVRDLAHAIHGSGIRADRLLRHLRRILDRLARQLDLLPATAPAVPTADPAPATDAPASA